MNKEPNRTVVAIVGASNDRSKFGNKALRAYLKRGFAVYPVSNREKTVEGLEAYPSVADIPGDIDRVSVYLRPKDTLEVLLRRRRARRHPMPPRPATRHARRAPGPRSTP